MFFDLKSLLYISDYSSFIKSILVCGGDAALCTVAGSGFHVGGCWPGLAPAGDWLSCPRKKVSKEGVLRSFCTVELASRLRRCAQTTTVSQTGNAVLI